MELRQRSKFEPAHDPLCSLLRRSPSFSRSLRKLSTPTIAAIWPWLRFVLRAPGGPLCPRPGSDQSRPPGTFCPTVRGVGCGEASDGLPWRAGLKLHDPSGVLSTAGAGGATPLAGRSTAACGGEGFASPLLAAAEPEGACAGAAEGAAAGGVCAGFGIFGVWRTSKAITPAPDAPTPL